MTRAAANARPPPDRTTHPPSLSRPVQVRVEKARQHEEWLASIGSQLPTPRSSFETDQFAAALAAAAPGGVAPAAGGGAGAALSPTAELLADAQFLGGEAAATAIAQYPYVSLIPAGGVAGPPPPAMAHTPPRALSDHGGGGGAHYMVDAPSPARSSLESLSELESILEAQHQQLISKGFLPPSADGQWPRA